MEEATEPTEEKMAVNKRLITIKGHYFFYNSGTAPLVPYMTSYARQLGIDATTVGYVYTGLPVLGLVVKPTFGAIADRFNIHKALFLLFQIVTLLSFSFIYFIPSSANLNLKVELDCGAEFANLKTCFSNKQFINSCYLHQLSITSPNETIRCKMSCTITSAMMWKIMCEQWHLPEYCTGKTNSMNYNVDIAKVSMVDDCALIATSYITLSDGRKYKTSCNTGNDHVDVKMHCKLNCTNKALSAILDTADTKMKCVDEAINYEYCAADAHELANIKTDELLDIECMASCVLDVNEPWQLMEVCQGFDHSAVDVCLPEFNDLPESHTFTAELRPNTVLSIDECVYMEMSNVTLENGYTRIPYCKANPEYTMGANYYHAGCEVSCNNVLMNDLILSTEESFESRYTQTSMEFWLLIACLSFSWMGQAIVVTFADAICFNMLGKEYSKFGEQRLWGSVGWGIFSLVTGVLIDYTSDGAYKNYTAAFILTFIFLLGDVLVSCFMKTQPTRISTSMYTDLKVLLKAVESHMFWVWCMATGACMGLVWQFLFWHIEDVHNASCEGGGYVKTLQGLVSAIQMFCGEIPFLYLSGHIIKKLGHANTMSLVILGFGVRFLLYSSLSNPWYFLPIELMQGVTVGLMYPVMASYANSIATPGTETTVQGLVGAVFEGVGTSCGSFIGGQLYDRYSGAVTFRLYGVAALIFGFIHILFHYLLRKHSENKDRLEDEDDDMEPEPNCESVKSIWSTSTDDVSGLPALPAIAIPTANDENTTR